MNEYIKILPGKLLKADGSQTNLLDILGIDVDPMTVRNDGYKRPEIASVIIGENQYALADILEAVAAKLNAPTIPLKLGTLADGDTLVYDGEEEAFVNQAAAE